MAYNMAANMLNADYGQAAMNGLRMASAAGAINDQNALRALYKQHGPGIAQGDPAALNALATVDPMQALSVRGAHADMSAQAERLSMAREQIARQYAQEARALRTEDLQRRANGLENASAYFQQGNHDAALQILAQVEPEAAQMFVGSRQRDEQWAAGLATALEGARQGAYLALGERDPQTMREQEPGSIEALRIRAQEGGLVPGTPDYAEFMRTGGRMEEGFALSLPDGTQIAQGNIGNFKFTEQQSKDNVFAVRARGALDKLEPVADALTSRRGAVAEMAPLGLGRGLQSDDYQVAKQAGDEFLQAILRKDTGAAITEPEQELYGDTYLPRPGDGPAVLQAKAEARIRALEALQSGMNQQQMEVVARAEQTVISKLRDGGGAASDAAIPPIPPSLPPEYHDLWPDMTPDERALFQ